jgi:hypothetical protein
MLQPTATGLTGPSLACQAHRQASSRLRPVGTASARTARGHHAWPRPERAWWWAHRRLNTGEGVELTEGKWSLDLGLPAATRKLRRGGQEGGGVPHRSGAQLGVEADKRLEEEEVSWAWFSRCSKTARAWGTRRRSAPATRSERKRLSPAAGGWRARDASGRVMEGHSGDET